MSNEKIALVTGANKGLGLETVKQLAEKGIRVFLAARDEHKGQMATDKLRASGLNVSFIKLDVTNSTDISKVVAEISSKYDKLDILVNNAGIENDGGWGENTVLTVSDEILKSTFETNFFAVIAVTRAFLPLLKKSDQGRIVNLSSIMGSLTLHADPASPIYNSKPFAYDASKTALNQFTVHLAHALKDTNIKVNSAHPGWVKTDLGSEHAPMDVTEGAKTSVLLATADNESPTGGYFHFNDQLPW